MSEEEGKSHDAYGRAVLHFRSLEVESSRMESDRLVLPLFSLYLSDKRLYACKPRSNKLLINLNSYNSLPSWYSTLQPC